MTNNNGSSRRPKPANNNRPAVRPSNYEFLPYAGTGTEVVDDLVPGAAPTWRLIEIAKWHDAKHARRNRDIAARLRAVAAEQDAVQVAA